MLYAIGLYHNFFLLNQLRIWIRCGSCWTGQEVFSVFGGTNSLNCHTLWSHVLLGLHHRMVYQQGEDDVFSEFLYNFTLITFYTPVIKRAVLWYGLRPSVKLLILCDKANDRISMKPGQHTHLLRTSLGIGGHLMRLLSSNWAMLSRLWKF